MISIYLFLRTTPTASSVCLTWRCDRPLFHGFSFTAFGRFQTQSVIRDPIGIFSTGVCSAIGAHIFLVSGGIVAIATD